MRTTKAISVTLTHRQADMVRAKVASGEYASESEVIREGLRMLEERNQAVEEWLRKTVVPTLDRVRDGKEKLIPATDVLSGIEARYRARKRRRA